eukprot:TRINITY_DN4451_c0_g1_i1.p1 TRINITY_DN4451_c0_g1~~TRINITY_DN4451_c0_g1_i1.p1  ORF type:complete len:224 (+),score=19.99 TRINITY_DN4451_c0_g1_i1:40-672(+)
MHDLRIYQRGVRVLVYSATLSGWALGTVVDVDDSDCVVVHFLGPGNAVLEKRFPPGHEHCRVTMESGEQVEVYSSTLRSWLLGTVVDADADGFMVVQYDDPNGHCFQKRVPLGHEHVRTVGRWDSWTQIGTCCAASKVAQDPEQTFTLSRKVRISEDAPDVHYVEPYCDLYGIHPAMFDFDAAGNMVLAGDPVGLLLRARARESKTTLDS